MLDFFLISKRTPKQGVIEIYPTFIIKKSNDLMIRGRDFYAVWLEDKGMWSTDEDDLVHVIDNELDRYYNEHKAELEVGAKVRILHMRDSSSGMIDAWHKYCQKQMRDNYHMLDETLIFANTPTKKENYASKRLSYSLEPGKTPAYDRLLSVLYSEEEREKINWIIGSIVTGDSKKLQKFVVLYGASGTGKSTVLEIIQQLFDCYCDTFNAHELGINNASFVMEQFKNNPLVSIDRDGDLSRIETNTKLNTLVSHEPMTVNEKFKSPYAARFKCMLFVGTNKPVKITDAKSGLIRRLIDVVPTGEKLPIDEYNQLVGQIPFELGAIAYRCKEEYLANRHKYDNYIPINMLGATNDFYNFVMESYAVFKRDNMTTLTAAYEMYKNYCDDANIPHKVKKTIFREELKNYFREFRDDRTPLPDGSRPRALYVGFIADKFQDKITVAPPVNKLELNCDISILDSMCKAAPAQYANDDGTPTKAWDSVKTVLADLDTRQLHYVRLPENHIVIDFDIPDENGNKSLKRNLEEAAKWPPTYAELSKSGCGVHLHYIYAGDTSKLSRLYKEHIEIKVFTGKSSLRRKLSRCNDIPVAQISSGLPLKEEKVINFDSVQSEKTLRTMIKKNLNKDIHPATKPSVDFIFKLLDDAYTSGLHYDVSDMYTAVLAFATNSTHQADYCIKLVNKMKFKSEEASPNNDISEKPPIVFYDVEVFINLFVICWKLQGKDNPIVRMINPKPQAIEELLKYRLVGFNCRRYDNHILYGALMGYTNEQLYKLSQKIISGDTNAFFGEAYNISYTDIYDFSSKKQSLKKFEIELGIHHQELGLPWDKPVPEELWQKVAEYCDNDVIATEAVFDDRKADFTARQILADVAGMSVNDTTNSLTTRIIFGKNRKPQNSFNYRDMGKVPDDTSVFHFNITPDGILYENAGDDEYTIFDEQGRPIFPGYKYEGGKSTYRDEEVGEGGYVYSEPGMYRNIALLDIASMHPSSIVAEKLFGDEFTQRFKDILDARIAIKHKKFDKAKNMLNGALAKYLDDENAAADLAQALKIAINSVYGLTAANFENPFRDIRNKDNIVAKRGALFMINLKHEVQKRGFTVAHIKTDSIKIPDATPEIIQFVQDYGAQYGYNFEHEATYDRMCLVNDSVYIAKYQDGKHAGEWTATGAQFQVPYVFKTLFSKENIEFEDMCETKSVTSALYLDMNEDLTDVSKLESEREKLWKQINDPDRLNESMDAECDRIEELSAEIEKSHNYHFVGKVGQFCPIKSGCGGGLLVRETENKNTKEKGYAAATGSKGYRWLESEMVKTLGKEQDIDLSYYTKLVDEAVEKISEYGDFEGFVA